jgi:hypothetical protein
MDINNYHTKLKNNGIFYIKEYIKDKEVLVSLYQKVYDLINNIDRDIDKEYPDFFVESKNSLNKSSVQLSKRSKTTLNFRGIAKNKINLKTYSYDNGFCDIINAELLFTDIHKLDLSFIKEICKKIKLNFNDKNDLIYNIYYTESVQDTRTWHKDGEIYKFFIYLQDVELDNGPYSYIKNSNDQKIKLDKNKEITEDQINNILQQYPYYQKKIYLGEKGDLIVSNQNGIHRGQPQSLNFKRIVLVIKLRN